jgi:hypothetical protein
LVADDDIKIAKRVKVILTSDGYETIQIKSVQMTIILDRPLKDYLNRILSNNVKQVIFLCGECSGAHLINNLREMNIHYVFRDIPVEQWDKWKTRPEYYGD